MTASHVTAAALLFIETREGVQRATPEEVLAYLRSTGADVSFSAPPPAMGKDG